MSPGAMVGEVAMVGVATAVADGTTHPLISLLYSRVTTNMTRTTVPQIDFSTTKADSLDLEEGRSLCHRLRVADQEAVVADSPATSILEGQSFNT